MNSHRPAMNFSNSVRSCRILRMVLLAILLLAAGFAIAAEQKSVDTARPELRAIWVDGFHAGIRTPEEVSQLVKDAKAGNFNALFVQVRGRGDAYFTKSIEPPVEEAPYDPGFDALAYLIEVAHQQGIEIHAWMNAMPIWRNAPPPKDPRHAFNQHGPASTGEDMWLTESPEGKTLFPVGYFLDPGNPRAAAYLADVYTNVVRNYPGLDGIHFDYIRYPETEEKTASGLGSPVGYNPMSVERFQRATHRTDVPAPDDPQFIEWRRQQVTQLVRRVYLQAKEINPRIRVSAAVIPWGRAPKDEKDFANVAPMQRVFQNWAGWLKEGILDTAVPMNYAREQNDISRGYYNGWINFEKRNKFGRSVVVGIGGYLNTPEDVLKQISRTRIKSGKYAADGVSIFSYFSLTKHEPQVVETSTTMPATTAEALLAFTSGSGPMAPVFPSAVAVPHPDWLDNPSTGWLAGFVSRTDGKPADGATVVIRRAGGFPLFKRKNRVVADGNGFYGFSRIKPGRYVITLSGNQNTKAEAEIAAGKVTRTNLNIR
jgi:uncharacterized lipoprotein YddW (UPF0748 family)